MNWQWMKKRCIDCYNKNKGRFVDPKAKEFEIILCKFHAGNYNHKKIILDAKNRKWKK